VAGTAGENHLNLKVQNLGPIAEADIELRPMSVFVGPSNTGKSYLATLIYALHQFFGAYSGAVERTAQGLPFSFPMPTILPAKVVLSENDLRELYLWADANIPKFEGGRVRWVPRSDIPKPISALLKPAFDAFPQYSNFLDSDVVRCFGVDHSERLIRYGSNEGGFTLLGSFVNGPGSQRPFSYKVTVTEIGSYLSAEIAETAPLGIDWDNNMAGVGLLKLPWNVLGYTVSNHEMDDDPRQVVATALLGNIARAAISETINLCCLPAHYLPADRAGATRSHQALVGALVSDATRAPARAESQQPTFTGIYGDFLRRLVALRSSPLQGMQPQEPLSVRMEQDILKGEIRVDSNPVGYPSFFYRPHGGDHDLPLMNTSSMVSELAPVVLYLRYVVRPGETLIIEEPESALHPAMQVELTRLLAAAVKAGIRIIITTHSEWVLEELANLVLMSELPDEQREGLDGGNLALSPEEIGAWLFEPSNLPDGGTVVKEIPLDTEMGNFPSGFGLITAELYNRYARISNRIERLKEG